MVNINKLVGAIYEKGLNKSDFVRLLGKRNSWLSSKLRNKNFTIAEADKIAKVLNLTAEEATAIFFSQYVA